MTKKEYAKYQETVAQFFDSEGIQNLSAVLDSVCCACDEHQEAQPYFSHSGCDCCGSKLGGDRYHANGYNPTTKEAQCYEVCMDCVYYGEYGQLDDETMMSIDDEGAA